MGHATPRLLSIRRVVPQHSQTFSSIAQRDLALCMLVNNDWRAIVPLRFDVSSRF